MESIAAYADEGSNASLNEEGSSDQDEVGQGEETFPEKGDGIDAVDDNAEDGYREEKSGEAEYDDDDESKDIEEDSKDPSSPQMENPQESQEEGELSMSSDTAPKESSREMERSNEDTGNAEVENQSDENTGNAEIDNQSDGDTGNAEIQSDQNGLEDEEEEDDGQERVLPQEVTTPFSLASFLSSVAPQITDEAEDQPSESKEERDLEFAYINGTYARVAKNKVDISELDRRLDDLRQQRKEEIGLLKMYGLDDREDRAGGRGGDARGGGRDRDDDSRGGGRDRDQDDGGRRRSRSRSRDRDREKRRSRSRERRRSRSRERRRSRSKDRSSRRERESPDRGRGRDDKDRYGRDRDKSGRDREDKGRDRDRFGREKDRFGRERDREDRKDDREHGRSRSPRNDRRDSNTRFSGRGEGSNQFRDVEKPRNDAQEKYGDKRGGEGPYSRKQDTGYSGGQDFYPSQQPLMPLPVPPPDSFPQNQFPGPQGFSQPPPPLDPFSASIPPPQPWMGGPPGFQQPPPPQQAPPPPHLGNYCQPPPPLPPTGNVNPMNNGDMNTLKQSLSILTGAASDPMGGGGGAQGFGGPDPSQPPPSSWGVDTGYSDSGPLDDDPMDLDLPLGSDDYQGRVVEEVKNAIRPFFNNRQISKEDYKEILKKCVPKVIGSGEINTKKICNLVGAYVKKLKGRPK